MSEPKLVWIVDPVGIRAENMRKELAGTFKVEILKTGAEAEVRFAQARPWAVVVSFLQRGRHGLHLCLALRAKAGGEGCILVGHGPLPNWEHQNKGARREAEVKWGLDHFIPRELEAQAARALLVADLNSSRRRERALAKEAQASEPPLQSAPGFSYPPDSPWLEPQGPAASPSEEAPERGPFSALLRSDFTPRSLRAFLFSRRGGRRMAQD